MDSGNRADSGSAAEAATSGGTTAVCMAQTHRMAIAITGKPASISKTDCAVPSELECVAAGRFECVATSRFECVATGKQECAETVLLASPSLHY